MRRDYFALTASAHKGDGPLSARIGADHRRDSSPLRIVERRRRGAFEDFLGMREAALECGAAERAILVAARGVLRNQEIVNLQRDAGGSASRGSVDADGARLPAGGQDRRLGADALRVVPEC